MTQRRPFFTFEMKTFSGLYSAAWLEAIIVFMTWLETRSVDAMSPSTAWRTYPWFQVHKYGSGDVVLVVSLIKEHILPISSFGCPFLEDSLVAYTVLSAESLPENRADLIVFVEQSGRSAMTWKERAQASPWFPHCPSCIVTISRGMRARCNRSKVQKDALSPGFNYGEHVIQDRGF